MWYRHVVLLNAVFCRSGVFLFKRFIDDIVEHRCAMVMVMVECGLEEVDRNVAKGIGFALKKYQYWLVLHYT